MGRRQGKKRKRKGWHAEGFGGEIEARKSKAYKEEEEE